MSEQAIKGRKLSQWVLYHDAWLELSELFESHGNTIGGAHADAARCIAEKLKEGTLRTKTLVCEDFVLRFEAPTLGREWQLGEGGEIPREFWTFFFEAVRLQAEDYRRGTVSALGEGDEANIGRSSVWFVMRTGLKENGQIIGNAENVLLYRPDIAQLGKRRGERGASYDEYDVPAAERVLSAVRNGADRGQAIKAEAKNLPGAAPVVRLRQKVRRREIQMR